MNWTTMIAIYGGLLSTIAIIWNIRNDIIRNKPKVKVSASAGFYSRGNQLSKEQYIFQATNMKKVPVTLEGAGIRTKEGMDVLFINNADFPKKIDEGEKMTILRDMAEFYEEFKTHKAKFLWFRDSKGKKYKSRSVKKLFSKKLHQ
jgi:hypothetical protein